MALSKLKKIRESFGYTQKFVADYLNVSRTTYTQYETGANGIGFDKIVLLKHLFNTTDDKIFLPDRDTECDTPLESIVPK